jgi:hypothetical protein
MGAVTGAIRRGIPPSFTRGLEGLPEAVEWKFVSAGQLARKALDLLRFTLDCSMMRPVECPARSAG